MKQITQLVFASVDGRAVSPLLSRAFAAVLVLSLAVLPAAIPAAADDGAAKVNLNTADSAALQYIPGIGPGRAADIIRLREEKGGFRDIAELLEIPGIGEKTLLDLKQYGTLTGGVSELSEEMRESPPVRVPREAEEEAVSHQNN